MVPGIIVSVLKLEIVGGMRTLEAGIEPGSETGSNEWCCMREF